MPVGTADKVRAKIARGAGGERGSDLRFDVVSNPEFLKEGAAVADCMRPDRIVIGTSDDESAELLREVYAPFSRNHDKIIVMDVRSAELTKYAANAMLATKISFMNEIAASPSGSEPTSRWCARASAPTRASATTSSIPAPATAGRASPRT